MCESIQEKSAMILIQHFRQTSDFSRDQTDKTCFCYGLSLPRHHFVCFESHFDDVTKLFSRKTSVNLSSLFPDFSVYLTETLFK